MSRLLPLVLLVACGGPLEETLVDELRIVAAPLDPPEVVPGEGFGAAPLVVDPEGRDIEVAVWTCVIAGPPGTPCLELAAGPPPVVFVGAAGERATLTAPAAAAALLPEPTSSLVADLRMLACAPGVCPILDTLRGGVDPTDEDLFAALSDPAVLLRELPLEGVSFARRDLRLVGSPEAARRENPRITPIAAPNVVVDGAAAIEFVVLAPPDLEVVLYPFASAGGFDAPSAPVVDARATVRWLAPEVAPEGPVRLWVVASDARGGESVWTHEITVGE